MSLLCHLFTHLTLIQFLFVHPSVGGGSHKRNSCCGGLGVLGQGVALGSAYITNTQVVSQKMRNIVHLRSSTVFPGAHELSGQERVSCAHSKMDLWA